MAGKFEILKSTNDKFYFNLKAGNGEVILTSQMYTAIDSAHTGIESVRVNSVEDSRFERKESSAGEPYFVLKAANHEPIGRSEMYSSAASMENGILSVRNNAPEASVLDRTAE